MRNHHSEKLALKWLILIGLLWGQFAYASHQLAHGADDLGETCQICTSFDRIENALSDAGVAATMRPAAYVPLPQFASRAIADRLQVYSARASPQSP